MFFLIQENVQFVLTIIKKYVVNCQNRQEGKLFIRPEFSLILVQKSKQRIHILLICQWDLLFHKSFLSFLSRFSRNELARDCVKRDTKKLLVHNKLVKLFGKKLKQFFELQLKPRAFHYLLVHDSGYDLLIKKLNVYFFIHGDNLAPSFCRYFLSLLLFGAFENCADYVGWVDKKMRRNVFGFRKYSAFRFRK